jgi:hypothetical protein
MPEANSRFAPILPTTGSHTSPACTVNLGWDEFEKRCACDITAAAGPIDIAYGLVLKNALSLVE